MCGSRDIDHPASVRPSPHDCPVPVAVQRSPGPLGNQRHMPPRAPVLYGSDRGGKLGGGVLAEVVGEHPQRLRERPGGCTEPVEQADVRSLLLTKFAYPCLEHLEDADASLVAGAVCHPSDQSVGGHDPLVLLLVELPDEPNLVAAGLPGGAWRHQPVLRALTIVRHVASGGCGWASPRG